MQKLHLAPLALFALKVLLNTTQKIKCHKEVRISVIRKSLFFKVQSVILQSQLVMLQGTQVGHVKSLKI